MSLPRTEKHPATFDLRDLKVDILGNHVLPMLRNIILPLQD
jgi:hypothetical protein